MTMMYGGCKLKPKVEELEAKLATAETQSNIDRDTIEGAKEYIRALEKERDELQAHNARLYRGMEGIANATTHKRVVSLAIHYAAIAPSDSAAKVQGLVDALELITRCTTCTGSAATADNALKKWRNSHD